MVYTQLPNLVIAGAPKCGTTALHRWLADHPDVAAAPTKETRYFVDTDSHVFDPAANYRHQGLDGYRRFFPVGTRASRVIESTPIYLYSQTALDHLPDIPSVPQFVFVVREPAAQIYSTYTYYRNNWAHLDPRLSFANFVELARQQSPSLAHNELLRHAFDYADYARYLERWIERCGRRRIIVLVFEQLRGDPAAFMTRLAGRLNLASDFYRTYDYPQENASYEVRWHWLQRVNLVARRALPDGRCYRGLRRLYRRLNTQRPERSADETTPQVMADLRRDFAEASRRLASQFQLDLSSWGL